MAVVEFDADEFRELFPQFSEEELAKSGKEDTITDVTLEWFFLMACEAVGNRDKDQIPYEPEKGVMKRKIVLYLYVCHLATLSLLPTGVSGPLSSAAEGSVSVGYSVYADSTGSWFNQTPCGQALWQMTMYLRIGGRYYADKTHRFHPWG